MAFNNSSRWNLHLQVREMHNGSNGVIGSNVVMKISSHGSDGSNHEVMNLKVDHVIMKQSIVLIR